MNIKKYICLAGLILPVVAMAQQDKTLCDFETPESYVSVRAYDTCPISPFNLNRLKGNVQVVDNDLNEVDSDLGYAPDESSKILGVQRSRFGSNTFGALVELKEPFALEKKTQYIHVKISSTRYTQFMLIGLGNRDDRPWQPATTEQFWSLPTKIGTAGKWKDVVFPVTGAKGVTIKSLLVVVDRQSPHDQKSDFAVFIDDIILSSKVAPFFSKPVYPINYNKTTAHTRADRYIKSVGLGSQTAAVNQDTDKKLYIKNLDDIFLARPGETVTPAISWKGERMHGYAYLDKGNDGKFNVDYTDTGIADNKDLVAFSYYKGEDSKGGTASDGCGVAMPSFRIAEDQTPGIYRMRYKVDWDNADPGGSTTTDNNISDNGGGIVDVLVNIHADEVDIYRTVEDNGGGLNGEILLSNGKPVTGQTTPFGRSFKIKTQPAEGFLLDYVKIRHGYNLEGANMLNENPQWKEYTVQASQFVNGEYTIPADCVDGNIRFVPYFKSKPSGVDSPTPATFTVKAGKGEIVLNAELATRVEIVNLQGSLLFSGTIEGSRTICVHQGVYIVNGEKILVW